MSTMTDTVDISRLLVNGRVGLSFRKFDKQVKQWIKTHYKHMAPYFYTSKRENIGQRQPKRRKRYATMIFELYEKLGSRAKSRWSKPEQCSAVMIREWFSEQEELIFEHIETLAFGAALKKIQTARIAVLERHLSPRLR